MIGNFQSKLPIFDVLIIFLHRCVHTCDIFEYLSTKTFFALFHQILPLLIFHLEWFYGYLNLMEDKLFLKTVNFMQSLMNSSYSIFRKCHRLYNMCNFNISSYITIYYSATVQLV